ncbi:MAG: hypothetical protein ACK5XT_02790 [Gemmatimonas sp.]|uniref:hypothetical protein n=2 Tax=Gemmatimonas sp. TaxID=1962908 RepID=UPI00391F31F4|nr:hypothetical protein [Gemmatimonadota bacterium]
MTSMERFTIVSRHTTRSTLAFRESAPAIDSPVDTDAGRLSPVAGRRSPVAGRRS